MAGIGFELRRLIDDDADLLQTCRGYASAGLVAAGPWIMTITGISILHAVAAWLAEPQPYNLFRAIVTYGFVGSLIIVGFVQMAYTRHVADRIYSGEVGRALPAFLSALRMITTISLIVSASFAFAIRLPLDTAVASVALFVVLTAGWLALIWIGIIKDHDALVRAYAIGLLASVGLTIIAGRVTDGTSAAPLIGAYAIGQATTVALIVLALLRGLPAGHPPERDVQRSIKTYPKLAATGLFYTLGLWADQIVVWFSQGVHVHPGIAFHPTYDACRFLAYLTVVPALAINLVRVETTFYDGYRTFYGSLLGGASMGAVGRSKRDMLEVLRDGSLRLLRVQSAVTILVLIAAPQILNVMRIPESSVAVFRACVLGSLFHVFLLTTLLILLYFDRQTEALITTASFVTLNLALAAIWHERGPAGAASAYAVSSLVGLGVAGALLTRATQHLIRATFLEQRRRT